MNHEDPRTQRFYRVVATDPPTIADFRSRRALGKRSRRDDPETRRLESGVSVYRQLRQARYKAKKHQLGRYIAELHVPEESTITFARTGDAYGHYTVWGEPAELLACVVSVVPV